MAISPNTPTLSRRNMLASMATGLAASTVTVAGIAAASQAPDVPALDPVERIRRAYQDLLDALDGDPARVGGHAIRKFIREPDGTYTVLIFSKVPEPAAPAAPVATKRRRRRA